MKTLRKPLMKTFIFNSLERRNYIFAIVYRNFVAIWVAYVD